MATRFQGADNPGDQFKFPPNVRSSQVLKPGGKRPKQFGKGRKCTKCNTPLNIYNKSTICGGCKDSEKKSKAALTRQEAQ